MDNKQEKTLTFLVVKDTQTMGPDSYLSKYKNDEINVQILAKQFNELYDSIDSVFFDIEKNNTSKKAPFVLEEIEIKVDVSCKAGFRIIASAEMETTGGISLKFKRRHDNASDKDNE